MTIAHDSKSYPYFAIAQHYNVSYSEVLEYAELIKDGLLISPAKQWQVEVWRLRYEQKN